MIPPSTISFNRCGYCGEIVYNTTAHNCAYVESGPTSQPQATQEWTTTPPTETGYYFVVISPHSGIYGADGNRQAQVYIKGGTVYFFGDVAYDLDDIAHLIDWWQPVAIPEPPKQTS